MLESSCGIQNCTTACPAVVASKRNRGNSATCFWKQSQPSRVPNGHYGGIPAEHIQWKGWALPRHAGVGHVSTGRPEAFCHHAPLEGRKEAPARPIAAITPTVDRLLKKLRCKAKLTASHCSLDFAAACFFLLAISEKPENDFFRVVVRGDGVTKTFGTYGKRSSINFQCIPRAIVLQQLSTSVVGVYLWKVRQESINAESQGHELTKLLGLTWAPATASGLDHSKLSEQLTRRPQPRISIL